MTTRLPNLPGPNARALLARDVEVVSPSYPRDYPFVMAHGRGTQVWDVDGNRFLDFAAGIAVCSTGHAHPRVVDAVKGAADKFLHISSDYWHEEMTGLGERLARLAPFGEPAMSFFCQSGTEAVEAALKLARYVTGRPRFLAFLGGFHGRTMGSLAATSSKYTQQKGFFAPMPGVTHVPYPNPYRPLFAGADQGRAVLDYIRILFERNVPASEVAAILVEPIQGEAGIVVPPEGFLRGLRELCDRHDVLLVCDEIQSGLGRTGKLFAFEHEGIRPDIAIIGKALSGGLYPVSGILADDRVMDVFKPGDHGSTYGGNALAAATARAALRVLVEEKLIDNSARLGAAFIERLRGIRSQHVKEIRGKGLWIGIELKPEAGGARRFCEALRDQGLLCKETHTHVIRVSPPLVISESELDWAFERLERALTTL
jgi:4-aminobutyrate aminotransferase